MSYRTGKFWQPDVTVATVVVNDGRLLMVEELVRVPWEDLSEAVPAFVATVMMPFSFTITEGIAAGFIAYTAMKLGTGRWREISACTAIMTVLFLGRYIFL